MTVKKSVTGAVTRRQVLKVGGAAAAVAGIAPLIAAPAIAATRTFKIGYVSPETGPLASFGEADDFMLGIARKYFGDGIKNASGKKMPVEIIVKDSQSNANRAASVASNLILNDNVDLMLVASTPETTNPVSDQCETNGVPCISTMSPWQSWFFNRGGKPGTGFEWTYLYFWGLEDVIGAYTAMWSHIKTDKVVGGLFPNDGDGNVWGDKKLGFPPVLHKLGYKLIDPGRFPDMNDNFSNYISAFKQNDCQILTGVMIPPDAATFLTQAKQQGLKPPVITIGKGLLFPSVINGLGATAQNLSCEYWWGPTYPYKSSLTGATCQQLCDEYTASTKRQWTQHIGFAYSLFEVAADIAKRVPHAGDAKATLHAVVTTNLNSVVGPIAWNGKGPVKNVSKTPMVGGQWRHTKPGSRFKNDILVVVNDTAPQVKVQSHMEPYGT
ncbi:MAG: ABC transporter substrate-binding protein [Stellaceae bacterium]